MKFDFTTPRDQLEKVERRALFVCRVLFIGGIFFVLLKPFLAILLFAGGFWFAFRSKKARDFIESQNSPFSQRVAEIDARYEASIARIRKEHAEAAERWQQFLEENEVVREIHTKVAGVTFRNSDGTSRQKILADAMDDGVVEFEYHSYKGAPAYAVLYNGDQIGNLPADLARDLYDLDDTYTFVGKISAITGGDGLSYGCNLLLTLYKEK